MDEYIKKTWKDGEVITAAGLNNIETGIVEAKQAAQQVEQVAGNAAKEAAEAKQEANGKAPAYTYGTDDLTAGESPLETGKLYFVYE